MIYEGKMDCSQERLQHEEAVAANNGVWWRAKLRVVPIDVDAAAEKGIRRGADKASPVQRMLHIVLSHCAASLALLTTMLGSLTAFHGNVWWLYRRGLPVCTSLQM